jgi:hypothetical protein
MYSAFGVDDEDSHRHWCTQSEKFASGEVLLEYLRTGWVPDNLLTVETFYFGGHRHLDVYHFSLRHGEDHIEIPVPANPAVWNVIAIYQLTLQLSAIGYAETQPL